MNLKGSAARLCAIESGRDFFRIPQILYIHVEIQVTIGRLYLILKKYFTDQAVA
jgi:hypothetical protein